MKIYSVPARCLLTGVAALLLAACGRSDTASFMIGGNDVALTLERIKEYAWNDGWELELIVRNFPECQRRYKLKAAGTDTIKVELYSPEPYVFIIKQGKRWYVTEAKNCQFQMFKEPPPQPGDLIGTFLENGKGFTFVQKAEAR